MRDLYLVSMVRSGSTWPIITFDEKEKAIVYIEENSDNKYNITLILFDPTY